MIMEMSEEEKIKLKIRLHQLESVRDDAILHMFSSICFGAVLALTAVQIRNVVVNGNPIGYALIIPLLMTIPCGITAYSFIPKRE